MLRTVPGLLAATGLAMVALSDPSAAQSFDCAKAGTAIEKKICSDPNLGRLDSELGKVYATLQGSLSAEAKADLRTSERAWVHQRNSCDTQSDCLTNAYVQRLGELDGDYSVFTGWNGTFQNWAGLQISGSNKDTQDQRNYNLTISGAGQNWTCNGTLSARVNDDGTALVVGQGDEAASFQEAGTGFWVPSSFDTIVAQNGFCGAGAPSFEGFFAVSSLTGETLSLDVSILQNAGMESPDAVRAFLDTLKKISATDDRARFASLVSYPFHLYDAGKVTATYQDATAFLKDYDRIMTKPVRDAIAEAHYADLFVNYQGAMLGNGQVWFYGFGEEDEDSGNDILIVAINP
ncbi:MAG: lysozyme inhibitor LprI family protein [Pseudomonadota bacterium]